MRPSHLQSAPQTFLKGCRKTLTLVSKFATKSAIPSTLTVIPTIYGLNIQLYVFNGHFQRGAEISSILSNRIFWPRLPQIYFQIFARAQNLGADSAQIFWV